MGGPSITSAQQPDSKAAGQSQSAAQPTGEDEEQAQSSSSEKSQAKAKASEKGSANGESSKKGAGETQSAQSPFWNTLDEIMNSGALGLLRKGGFFMWPLIIMGIVAAGVIIERYRSLKMLRTDSGSVRQEVHKLLQEDRIEEALQLCDREQGPVPAILSAGLRKFLVLRRLNYDSAKVEEQVVKAMDDYSVHVVAALERHLPVLGTISSAAPMLGFLGTVQGMIVAFQDIVEMMGETNIVEAAAAGISVALLTTCFGLIVGIPSFMAFNYFSSVINGFVLQVEESATELIESVTLHMALENRQPAEGAAVGEGSSVAANQVNQ